MATNKKSEGPSKGVPVTRRRPRSIGSVRSGLGDLAKGAEERLEGFGESP